MGFRTELINRGIGPFFFLKSGNPGARRAAAKKVMEILIGSPTKEQFAKFNALSMDLKANVCREALKQRIFFPVVLDNAHWLDVFRHHPDEKFKINAIKLANRPSDVPDLLNLLNYEDISAKDSQVSEIVKQEEEFKTMNLKAKGFVVKTIGSSRLPFEAIGEYPFEVKQFKTTLRSVFVKRFPVKTAAKNALIKILNNPDSVLSEAQKEAVKECINNAKYNEQLEPFYITITTIQIIKCLDPDLFIWEVNHSQLLTYTTNETTPKLP